MNLIKKIFAKESKQEKAKQPDTAYDLLGGEAGVRALANEFYDIMESAPEAADLYAIHPLPLDTIRQKFFEFLSGWTGGPGLFEEKYGHPRLRARHLPFKVDCKMRDQWMFCMNKALDNCVQHPELRENMRASLDQLASHMRNQ
ncbi:group II truncated hemoglobin [Motilimonas pumila]|uniref:Hemoglobin-like oxygen-binding protein n=1 Tax=Motilimonas pumila TaxID=2303987 RepID=A0A418YJ86_9GAMM|nr:group II truncated hemoglobin [Motilimonas pumila]RJG50669.1 hemoglobin-like oxygen-binding protein [Motilimonas pumila]